jgi:hypothetical protein
VETVECVGTFGGERGAILSEEGVRGTKAKARPSEGPMRNVMKVREKNHLAAA